MTAPLLIIDDTFAEAFPMKATRLIITAHRLDWARHAAIAATGFATSVIACGCEAGIERGLSPDDTPDGRPGVAILLFAMSGKELAKQVERRVGQCVLTCPTTAVYAGLAHDLPKAEPIALGKNLRFFGDGWQMSKVLNGQRYWRVPVMDGEFVAQETTPIIKGVGGGNLLLLARDTDSALAAAEAAVAAMRRLPNVILPFPGGVVRSGSKVGSRYAALSASTNDAFCPSLLGMARQSALGRAGQDAHIGPQGRHHADDSAHAVRCVMEIVIDGLSEAAVADAMQAGLDACQALGPHSGLLRVSAGNYGGQLGPFHFHLQRLQTSVPASPRGAERPAAHAAGRTVTLTLRRPPPLRLDLRTLSPAALRGLSAADIARLPLAQGSAASTVGDWFDISDAPTTDGDPTAKDDVTTLRLVGDLRCADAIAWGLTEGCLIVEGSVGDRVGCAMRGGTVRVHGSAGHGAGTEMSGGVLHIEGDVGDFAAATLPGSMDGMRGGLLLVGGRAGDRLGDRMRRGTVIVAGDVGDFAASRLVAGTLVLGGRCGAHPGYGMRRGTLVWAGDASTRPAMPDTWVGAGAPAAVFWQLLSRDLARIARTHLPPEQARRLTQLPRSAITRHLGDRSVDGRGEWIFPDPPDA